MKKLWNTIQNNKNKHGTKPYKTKQTNKLVWSGVLPTEVFVM